MRVSHVITALTLGFAALSLGCGGPLEYHIASSPKAPGADAHIVATVSEEQSTTTLKLDVKNLAPPARVVEGAEHYVIWHREKSAEVWARVGSLAYDEEARGGTFEGSVPNVSFDLSITAEENEDPASPSTTVVFSQRVSK